ncbi:MAG: IS21-like element helper ATPase IstB [Dehalococcoidia bacterium]
MATSNALAPRLRQLKLSGMRDAIAARAEEARTRGLDPLDFLQLLLDDEVARRETQSTDRRIGRARFEDVCDLRDFDFSFTPKIPKATIWELAACRFIENHTSVLLCGPTGVGKSFVAQALGVEACRQARRVLFIKPQALLTDLAGGCADGSWQPRLRRYLNPELLILDDFAMREYIVVQAEDLYEVVSRRYRRGSLILTTNRDPGELYPLFPSPVLAEGLLDRLINSAVTVTMLGRSYRPRQRPGGQPTDEAAGQEEPEVENKPDQDTGK